MSTGTLDALRNLSNMVLITAKSSKGKTWEELAKQVQELPLAVQQVQNPLSRLAASLLRSEKGTHAREAVPAAEGGHQVQEPTPAEPIEEPPQPKRVAREVAALKSTNILGDNTSPARNTRSRCASVAALTLLSASQASGIQWAPRNMYNDAAPMSSLAELANAVLDGDNILKYRQLINYPLLGPAWNTLSSNEYGRLAQGIGGRVKGTDTILFINKEDVPKDRVMDVT